MQSMTTNHLSRREQINWNNNTFPLPTSEAKYRIPCNSPPTPAVGVSTSASKKRGRKKKLSLICINLLPSREGRIRPPANRSLLSGRAGFLPINQSIKFSRTAPAGGSGKWRFNFSEECLPEQIV
ncbi:hypothetical protein L873DRAFT_1799222 [Choiromyces venosus 120613-1]|uniref:Uncharacterized protein n=1 Tax=Choiromyces venosus 120613-1 TaxID=1336337 RepID=A0A3N4KEQ3_9PEZI|nr:hypothetical protein L873DRAFT_1799222 [Choiromyces venosus 120613-1]